MNSTNFRKMWRPSLVIVWPDGPIRVIFSVLAVFSAVGLYFANPRFAESPLFFGVAALMLFAVVVPVFELCIRRMHSSNVSAEKALGNRVALTESISVGQFAECMQALTAASWQQEHLARRQAECTDELGRLTNSIQALTAALQQHLAQGQVPDQAELIRALYELKHSLDEIRPDSQPKIG